MLQLLVGTDIPFMRYRRFAYVFSSLLVAVTLAWFFTKGPRYSVDFTGGEMLQVRTSRVLSADEIKRTTLDVAQETRMHHLRGPYFRKYSLPFSSRYSTSSSASVDSQRGHQLTMR